MKRRTLLRATGGGAAGLLAGCLEGAEDPDGGRTPTDEGTRAGTDTSAGDGGDDGTPAETDEGDGGSDEEATAEPTDDGQDDDPNDDTPTDGDADEESGTGEETPADGDDGTSSDEDPSGSNGIVDRSFEVGSVECGTGEHRADVSRGTDRVHVDGTIRGRNGCYTAELEDATYDEGADELTVAVRSVDGGDRAGCQQCIVDVDYRASVEFEDGTPATVRVVHDGEHVTTA